MNPMNHVPTLGSLGNAIVPLRRALSLGILALVAGGACKKAEPSAEGTAAGSATSAADGKQLSIQYIGSDTMVNIAQAWAEEYAKVEPNVSVEVSGGGSGVGIAALINKTADIANASRKLEPQEEEKAKASAHGAPTEFVVGFDGLAIYVHTDNPLAEISVDQLAELYREGGTLSKWSALGVKEIPGAKGDDIIRVSRQNNSGTYHYFRETVLAKKDFKQGSIDMSGSKDVVEQVAKTPGAIGYSGLGYATPAVKMLKVSKKSGEPAILPSVATVMDKTYPISRPMFMYTPGAPVPHVKKYIDWVMSPAGQKIVEETGYVPISK
jgi:phosphate transport system substrate-binding protein